MSSRLTNTEEAVASHDLGRLYFDLKKDPVEVASYVLRAMQARPDLSQTLLPSSSSEFNSQLESVRTAIALGEIEKASALLKTFSPTSENEKPEYLLEVARVALLSNKLDQAIASIEKGLAHPHAQPWTKMTLLQIQGHILVLRQNYAEAARILEGAIHYTQIYPYAHSSICIRAFLAIAYTHQDQQQEARNVLDQLYTALGSLPKNEMWLDRICRVIRADSVYLRKYGTRLETLSRLEEAQEIAQWLNDQIVVKKCADDLTRYELNELEILTESRAVFRFSNWSFLKRFNLFLIYFPKSMNVTAHSPVAQRLISTLSAGPLPSSELFEKVWSISYQKERHDLHLRQALSKLRKLIPESSLTVQDRVVTLK